MNQVLRFVCLATILSVFTIGAFAQKDNPKKTDDYNKIAKLFASKKPEDKEKLFQEAKAFLNKYGKEDDEKTKKIKQLVSELELDKFDALINSGKTDDAFLYGKELLENDPNNLYVLINLAYRGYDAFIKKKDDSFAGDSINFAQQSIKLLDEGKTPVSFLPFKDQSQTKAWMYFVIGTFLFDSDEKTGLQNLAKSTTIDVTIKNNFTIYYKITNYYEMMFNVMKTDYDKKHSLKQKEDAEMKADIEKINNLLDKTIDAYARLVKAAETEKNPNVENWKTRLTQIYKFRKQTDSGLNDFISNIFNSQIPEIL